MKWRRKFYRNNILYRYLQYFDFPKLYIYKIFNWSNYFKYEYQYKVEDKPSGNYYGQNEVGKDTGRIEGSYFVYLPDGRLMTVTYYVDGESGFVPKITFQDNASPFGNSESNSIQRR